MMKYWICRKAIANDSGKKIIVCIDEFQNINEYRKILLAFQRKLRAHWQKNRHLSAIASMEANGICCWIFFNDYSTPFTNSEIFCFCTK